MTEVGVLTFHWANHIGAVLQAYALCEVLKSLGHKVCVINYRPNLELVASPTIRVDKLVKKYGILRLPLRKTIRSMAGEVLYYLFDLSNEIRRMLAFTSFREGYLEVRPKKGFTNLGSLLRECLNYEAVVVGSDLVWSPDSLKYSDFGYLLPFKLGSTMKIGFSASIGTEFSAFKELLLAYERFLKDFKFISVRERRHAEELSRILKRDVHHTLDPTLLVPKAVFEAISNDDFDSLPEKYVLLYNLDPSLLPWADLLERLTASPVIIYKGPNLREKPLYWRWIRNKVSFYHVGPQNFIALFKRAELILTDSYHGLTLSILFEKPVLVTISNRAVKIKSRIEDLTSLLDLQHRIVRRKEDVVRILREDIDYGAVRSKLSELRRNSIELLKEALET